MFLRYYCELPQAFELTESRLLEAPEVWLPGLAATANRRGELLLAQVGFDLGRHRFGKRVKLRLGPALRTPGRAVLPVTWVATGAQSLFPAFEGELELGALGRQWTQLVISVNYRPPLGPLGQTIDRLALHRLAEATIKDFLDRTGEALTGEQARGGAEQSADQLAKATAEGGGRPRGHQGAAASGDRSGPPAN
ncbi:MAG: hypothetical protein WBU92_04140 [Candidatus Dormiibacterota bacterium]